MVKRKQRILVSILLALILLTGMVWGIVASTIGAGRGDTSALGQGALTRVGNLDLDALRQLYFSDNLQNSPENYTGERWVVVELEGTTLYDLYLASEGYEDFAAYCASEEGNAQRRALEAEQAAFLQRLSDSGMNYKTKYSYTTVNNGLSLRVTAEDYRTLAKTDGVKGVYLSESYAVPKVAVKNNANVYTTGIYDTTGIDYKGEGMVVAILDTGLDYTHEAFTSVPKNPKWTKQTVADLIAAAGDNFYAKATADEVYYTLKVPFAYDYADDDADVFPQYSSHGTHVAGIVAGKSNHVVNKDTDETFLGVAPEAQLVICKVFTDNLDSDSLGGANNIDILAAISDCVSLGVDVINMSLGSAAGFSDEKSNTFFNEVYDKVKAAGIDLVVAASNDYSSGFGGGNGTNLASNPDSGTVGSPSTYDAALSVASINGQKSSYILANNDEGQVAFITPSSDENGNEFDFIEQLYQKTGKPKTEKLRFKYVVVNGVGRSTNYTTTVKKALDHDKAVEEGYDGTIALVKRGDITFAEKVQNAMDSGADACIIYNHLSGTIRMSLGEVDNPIPTCSIPMDPGKQFVANATRGVGTITVSPDFQAGPFMSDFSSWGPSPDLKLRPEITAHGGEITSAVPGGYDIYSGTSMAAPNMAGAIALLRQHLAAKYPSLSKTELTALINQLLMSTATIALNEEGNPYSPRKQGAGLAGIKEAIAAESYITVKDENGNVRDKTKIELYDDKKKTGVYELVFTVVNTTDKAQTYRPTTYVMTETLASDGKTVAEKAYMLTDSTVVYTVGGTAMTGDTVSVPANGSVEVHATVTLGAAGRKYLDDSFKNGMYIEGFVSLAATGDTKITVGLPYLAFYGDWNDAPLFDYSQYELAESQKDTSVSAENKLVASAADTKIIGRYFDDKYIISMGAYLYEQAETDVKIYPEKEKIALSMFDKEGQRTIYELYMVYAGLLRGAAYMDVEIRDSVTGDVVYAERQENVSKSYAAGGSNRGAPVMLEIRPDEWGLHNNNTYYVTMKGQLDYPGGENPERNSFDFQFTVDYEAPEVMDYRLRYEPYTENKQTKYRIYMDVDVYDNQYVQDLMPCYIREENGKNYLTLVTEHPIPVYGEAGKTSTVSFEVTDIYEDYVKTGKLYLAVEDYAMNQTSYVVEPSGAMDPLAGITLATDANLFDTEEVLTNGDADKTPYHVYELSLAKNQLYRPTVIAAADSARIQNLAWEVVSGGEYLSTSGQEIFARGNGKATLRLFYGTGSDKIIYAEVRLTVEGEPRTAPRPERITLSPAVNGDKWVVDLNGASPAITLHPNTTLALRAAISPWYVEGISYEWNSSDEDVVTVDDIGNITTLKKGTAYITVTAKGYPLLTKPVKVTVSSDYRVLNYTLYDYYGGEVCEIPENLNIMYLDEECFQYNTKLKRVVFPSTLTEIPKNAFKGCTNLEEIVIPGQCIVVGESAFENCTKLKTVEFGPFVDRDKEELPGFMGTITLARNAFRGCTALSEIKNQARMTAIHERTFENCTSLTSLDLTELRYAGAYAFAGCTSLTDLTLGAHTAVGAYMFSGCTALQTVQYPMNTLAKGTFANCTRLTSIEFTSGDFTGIGDYALSNTRLSNVTLPTGSYAIGESAFASNIALRRVTLARGTNLTSLGMTPFADCRNFIGYEVASDNPLFSATDGVLYNKEMTRLIAVPPAKSAFTVPATVREIADGAFAGATNLTTIDLTGYTFVGAYAFAGSALETVTLPMDMKALPEGIFSGCRKLASVNGTAGLTSVGAKAFLGCRALTSVALDAVTTIGDSAFRESGIRALAAPSLTTVGDSAFNKCASLTTVTAPALASIGESAFLSASSLTDVTLGGVTRMGSGVFMNCDKLANVTFGDGTTLVGEYAFFSSSARTNLTTVTLPGSVKTIGDFAFANATAVPSLNLSGVTSIGKYAFYNCRSLTAADLSAVKTLGDGAFSGAGLTSADLSAAETIGANAFSDVPLTSVTFGALRVLGEYAFTNTRLVTVTLPRSFSSRTYDYTWYKLDEKGRVEETKTRKVASFGAGAFSSIPTLTEIRVEGSGDFFAVGGVLYARGEDGNVLLQYPAARDGEQFTVPAGTVAIGTGAFEGVDGLTSVEFPHTLKRIGAYAFYNSTVERYVFNSVNAPALLSEYVDPSSVRGNSTLEALFGNGTTSNGVTTVYYANFYDFVAKRLYLVDKPDFNLHMTIPKNGVGYDTDIWTTFFQDIHVTEEILPDDTTHEAMDRIDDAIGAMTPDEIAAAGSVADLVDISRAVQAARLAYNRVTKAEQLGLLTARYEALLTYETALRDAKAGLGSPVAVRDVTVASNPSKIRYTAGETFDPAGMVIKVIYEDDSERIITDYTLDKTVLHAGDEYVLVTVTEGGTTYTLKVLLNVEGSDPTPPDQVTPDEPVTPDTPETPEKSGLPGWAIALIAAAGTVVAAGIAVTVVIILKKKKGQ